MRIRRRLITLVIVLISLSVALTAKPDYQYGLLTGSNSWGIVLNTAIERSETTQWMLDSRFYDCKGDHEFVIQSNYGGTYSFNEQSLILLPVFAGVRKTVLHNKIENNFIPFIEAGAGAVLVGDGDETIDGWFDRWKQTDVYLTPSAYVGAGLKFWFSNQNNIYIRIGFDYLPMNQTIDGKTGYHQAVVQFLFSK